MNNSSGTDLGDWLMGTVRRNPEGLLLLAAGCALMMRSGRGSSAGDGSRGNYSGARSNYSSSPSDYGSSSASERGYYGEMSRTMSDTTSGVRRGLSEAAETASDYASDLKEKASDMAGSYAESVSNMANMAGDARRVVSESSDRLRRQAQGALQTTMDRVLREQPLAVAMLGVAAGAAVAAAFPAT